MSDEISPRGRSRGSRPSRGCRRGSRRGSGRGPEGRGRRGRRARFRGARAGRRVQSRVRSRVPSSRAREGRAFVTGRASAARSLFMRPSMSAISPSRRKPASRRSSSSAVTAVASRATTSSSPPPSPRSLSASRTFRRRSTAIAAWFAKRPRSSISCRLKSVCCGRSRTERTPSAPSSCRSGAAMSPFGT